MKFLCRSAETSKTKYLFFQYKDISEAHELALNELTQSEQSSKSASDELLTQNKEEIAMLSQKLKDVNVEYQEVQSQLDEIYSKSIS